MKSRFLPAALVSLACVFSAMAFAGKPVDEALAKSLKEALEVPGMGVQVRSITASDIEGLYEVELANGPILYTTAKGDYFVAGDLYAVRPEGFVNLGELRRDTQRQEKMAAVATEDMIVFPAKGETKTHITVFTDVTCYYCRKLHQEVPQLNEAGVEVRYMAYPRAGVGTEGYQKLVTAWCADNPPDVLTRLKADESVEDKSCSDNPVTDQFQLGQDVGVRGTPAIVTQQGKLISGYMPADRMLAELGVQ